MRFLKTGEIWYLNCFYYLIFSQIRNPNELDFRNISFKKAKFFNNKKRLTGDKDIGYDISKLLIFNPRTVPAPSVFQVCKITAVSNPFRLSIFDISYTLCNNNPFEITGLSKLKNKMATRGFCLDAIFSKHFCL